jgi:dynein assembly factor 3
MTDKGRTIESRGYWGDILNSPYACFGVEAEDARLFKVSNRQHVKNAVEVSDYNVAANLFELRCVLYTGPHTTAFAW